MTTYTYLRTGNGHEDHKTLGDGMEERRYYTVRLRHDHGTVEVRTYTSSADAAAGIVCLYEKAPRSAVLSVTED